MIATTERQNGRSEMIQCSGSLWNKQSALRIGIAENRSHSAGCWAGTALENIKPNRTLKSAQAKLKELRKLK